MSQISLMHSFDTVIFQKLVLSKHLSIARADPESVKEALAKEQKWSSNRRKNVINYYTLFLKFKKATWEKPRCKIQQKIPFIPTESEINALISGTGRKTATFLQLLKETAMRSGEAKTLHWTET